MPPLDYHSPPLSPPPGQGAEASSAIVWLGIVIAITWVGTAIFTFLWGA